jgi:hypothetical protein
MKRVQIRPLFIFSNAIKEAKDAAAPISKAIAKDTDSQSGLERRKKSITWMVEMILTTK